MSLLDKIIQKQEKTQYIAGKKKINCEYILMKQMMNMTEGQKMDLVKPAAYRLFLEVVAYMFNNKQAIRIDLSFRKLLQEELGYSRPTQVNTMLKTLLRNDFIGHITEDLYLVNPLACFKGSYEREFDKMVERYYDKTISDQYSFNNGTRLTTLIEAYDEEK